VRLACCGESARDQPDWSLVRNTEPGQLWFTACLELTALSALAEGYEVFIMVDACGSPNVESHQTAVPGW